MAGINFINENEYSRPLKFAKKEFEVKLIKGDSITKSDKIESESVDLYFKIKTVEPLEGEIWVDAIYYDGSYSVSNFGRVKSETRYVANGSASGRLVKERILSQANQADGRLSVNLSINNKNKPHDVSVLVWESFNGEKPDGKVVMHKNKCKNDNRLSNLELTTWSNSHSTNFRLGLLPHLEDIHASMIGSKWNEENGIYVNGELTEILCNKCFTHKPLNEFERSRICCKKCRSASLGIKEFGKLKYIKELKEAGLKRCPKCTEVKSINDFHKDTAKCKKCKNEDYKPVSA